MGQPSRWQEVKLLELVWMTEELTMGRMSASGSPRLSIDTRTEV